MMFSADALISAGCASAPGERIWDGARTLIFGAGIAALAVLCILGMYSLYKIFSGKFGKKQAAGPVTEEIPEFSGSGSGGSVLSDTELAAVIAAAVAAYRETEDREYTGGFRVVSFRKTKRTSVYGKNDFRI